MTDGRLKAELDKVYASAEELHERIAAIDPNIVVTAAFGHRERGPAIVGSEMKPLADGGSFRDVGPNHIIFSKAGDGWINVTW
jgi:hypothetical protein